MAKRLQHRGGTTSQHSSFTGAVREVTVDTDKNTLVVHDGATAGGHPLATATNFKSTGIDDNATSTAISIDSSQNVSFNDDTGNTAKMVWNATDESLKINVQYGDYYVAYKVPQLFVGGVTTDLVLLIGEKDVNQIRITGRFYTPSPYPVLSNRNAFSVDILYQQWNSQLPRFTYDAMHTGSRAGHVNNMELAEVVYNGTTYYAITIQANNSSLGGQPIYFTGGITNTTDLGWVTRDLLTSYTAVTPSSNDITDKRINAENIRFKNEKNEDKMLITTGGDISFYEDTGTTPKFFWNASTERLGIGTTSPSQKLSVIGGNIELTSTGTGSGAQIHVTGRDFSHLILQRLAGGAANSQYRLSSSVNTLVFSDVSNDKEKLRLGLSESVFNEPGENQSFRVESDTLTHALFVRGSDGNVGIGTSSPDSILDLTSTPNNNFIHFNATTGGSNGDIIGGFEVNNTGGTIGKLTVNRESTSSSGYMAFQTGTTEKMRIQNNGNVGIGTTSPGHAFTLEKGGGGDLISDLRATHSTNPYGIRIIFTNGNPDNNTNYFIAGNGSDGIKFIVYSDGDVKNHDNSYGSISDERIKQDIRDSNSQWNDIKNVRVRNFKKKDDVREYGENAWEQIGVVAQELETVSPKLIKHSDPTPSDILSDSSFGTLYEEGDEIPEGKNIGDVKEVHQQVKGVSYSILYMKSIKALQEAMERIETLEARITALETNQP